MALVYRCLMDSAPGGELGREVGGYRLLTLLGSGGMGAVYEAADADGRRVALKLLHPALAADPSARERLRREVANLHRVRGARVARVLDAEADADEAFVVTELVPGHTLDASVSESGPYPPHLLHPFAQALADALTGIHAVGVVHRDLKPGNVMVTDDGPVLIDFGIAQVLDDARLTQTGMVTGTPGYLDPAAVAGGEPGTVGDWWGWAAVTLFAATGRAPFGRGPFEAVHARVLAGAPDVAGLSPAVARAFTRALSPDPRARPPRAELLVALEDSAHGREPTVVAPMGAPPGTWAADTWAPVPVAGAVADGDIGASRVPESPTTAMSPVPPTLVAPVISSDLPWRAPPAAPAGTPYPAVAGPAYGERPLVVEPLPAWAQLPPHRPVLTLVVAGALAAAAMVVPGVAAVTAAVGLMLLGAIGAAAQARRARRMRHGLRRTDGVRTLATAPWHLVRGAVAALPGLVLGAIVGVAAWWLLTAAVLGSAGSETLVGDTAQFAEASARAAALGAALVIAWWTPTSTRGREGWCSAVSVLAPRGLATTVWTLGALLVIGAVVIAVLTAAPVDWWPIPVPPDPRL